MPIDLRGSCRIATTGSCHSALLTNPCVLRPSGKCAPDPRPDHFRVPTLRHLMTPNSSALQVS